MLVFYDVDAGGACAATAEARTLGAAGADGAADEARAASWDPHSADVVVTGAGRALVSTDARTPEKAVVAVAEAHAHGGVTDVDHNPTKP